jgi:hypothetical protein
MSTYDRVKFLVSKLQLTAHPEGGFYKETYRSTKSISSENGEWNLLTSIYFLLTSENISKFHRIKSDELWYFHEGNNLTVHLLHESGYQKLRLGQAEADSDCRPFGLVKTNTIFGSTVDEPDGYALVSCAVAPGFDFNDFELLSGDKLLLDYPDQGDIIKRLT